MLFAEVFAQSSRHAKISDRAPRAAFQEPRNAATNPICPGEIPARAETSKIPACQRRRT